MLRATTACTFSTSQLQKVVRSWCVLYILTWKCASRHNGVHFFISHLASWVRTRRFSEPTFRPSGATNHWKNTVNRDFPTFSRICIFFLLIFSLLTLLTSAFQLSILSEVSLLNFLRPEFHLFSKNFRSKTCSHCHSNDSNDSNGQDLISFALNDDVLNGGPRAHNLREIVARGWMVHKERNGERGLGRELLGGPGWSRLTPKGGMVMACFRTRREEVSTCFNI